MLPTLLTCHSHFDSKVLERTDLLLLLRLFIFDAPHEFVLFDVTNRMLDLFAMHLAFFDLLIAARSNS